MNSVDFVGVHNLQFPESKTSMQRVVPGFQPMNNVANTWPVETTSLQPAPV